MSQEKMSSGELITGGETRMHQRRQAQGQPSTKLKKHKRQKHLYLVLDDWDGGYTIRKIDVDDDDSSSPALILSDHPAVRLVSPAPYIRMIFTSMGTHILAVSSQHPATLAYDTATGGLAAGPSLPDALLRAANVFVPAADALCAFAYYFKTRPQSIEVMSSSAKDPSRVIPCQDWSWRSVAPSPFDVDERVNSYATHPDGRTVFVSAFQGPCRRTGGPCARTFSFNTGDGEWRCHGEWALPFNGQGYFDGDLDAWVGLDKDGHVGTCQVVSRSSTAAGATAMQQQLDWKMAKHKLWSEEQQAADHGPTLTAMGNARFCLVDCVKGMEFHGRLLRVTTFRLRHSRKGELEIFDRSTRSCQVSKHLGSFSPVAFWM
ncbi:hypothetical protein CFC21_091754 [Triticum aestivum]|uniref:Uncharacterized protein n=4 Tax=Triticinae TaxID=1648030 RepID=A0A3B6QE75_WHEAT|nr:hypothetical protein CFC21_091754 [Triticum aestivum]